MRKIIGMIAVTLLFAVNQAMALPTFTDNFNNSSYIGSTTATRSGGHLYIGYPYIYKHSRAWSYKWGDMAYYNGNVYVTWADDRYNGVETVFVQKLLALDGSLQWTTNFVLGEKTNETYFPTVSVYDASHIYVAFRRNAGGHSLEYAARIDDSGASPSVIFYNQIDNGLSDNTHYFPYSSSSTVDDLGNFYVHTIWGYTGSGNRGAIQKVDSSGNISWGTGYMPINKYFNIAGDVNYFDGYLYLAAENWAWGSKDYGSYAQKMPTGSSFSRLWGNYKDIDGRGTINYIMRNYGAHNAVAADTNRHVLYFAWADRRAGNSDIYMTKMDTNGNFVNWSPSEKTMVSGSGDQESPNIAVLPTGDILLLYVDHDDSHKLKLLKVNKDDGSVSAIASGDDIDSVRPSSGYWPYNPTMTLISNQIYIAFETSYSADQVRVARFDYDYAGTGTLTKVWQLNDVQTVSHKIQSSMQSKAVSFNSLVGSAKTLKIDATYNALSGNVKFYLSADGQNFTNVATNTDITFDSSQIGSEVKSKIEFEGNGSDNLNIDSYVVTAVAYYTGNVLYGTNLSSLNGSGTLSSDPLVQTMSKKLYADGVNSNAFYLVITNEGNTAGDFYLIADGGTASWSVKYYDGASDVTASATGPDGYLISGVPAGGAHQINVVVTPSVSVEDGEEYLIFDYVTAKPGGAVHDSVSFSSIALKYLPDLAVEHSGSLLTLGYLETNASTQQDSKILNGRFYTYADIASNLLVISNAGVTNEEVEISNWLVGTASHWDVVYSNMTLSQTIPSFPYTVSIPAGGFQAIAVGARPKESAGVNETLDVRFLARVTNGVAYLDSARWDSGLFHYRAIQVQPDLMVSLNSNFSPIIGNDDYSYTNLNIEQTVTQRTVNNKEIRYYVRLQNDGLMSEPIHLDVGGITNTGWTESYFTNSVDITTSLTNSGLWYDFPVGAYIDLECRYTPDGTVLSGDTPDVVFTAFSSNKNYVNDVLHLRPRSFRVKPDLMISTASNGTFLSNDVYALSTADYKGQILYERMEPGNVSTNYFKIQNDSTTDPDNMRVRGTASTANWDFTYQTTNAVGWITVDLTNSAGYAQTLGVGESQLFRVIKAAKATATADEVQNVVLETWSAWVTNERDTTLLSNISVDLKPKLTVEGSDDGNYFTPNYDDAKVQMYALAGNVHTYNLQVQNAGGSVEDYTLKMTPQPSGGQLGDWSMTFLYITNNVTNDLTTTLTNSGWQSSFISNEVKGLKVIVGCTNIEATTNAASDRGAVSNYLSLNMDFWSQTKNIRKDRAALDVMLKRSMPDLEMLGVGNSTKNKVFPDYAATNFASYGIILKYVNDYSVKIHNNLSLGSMGSEDMIVKAEVSNVTGTYANWIWKFLDSNGSNVTTSLTNGSYTITNLGVGSFKTLKFRAVNSNGIVHDKVIVKFEVKTKYQQVRSDHVWYGVEIVPGFPEIVGSYKGETRGIDQFSPDSWFLGDIESGETNHFVLMMSNTAPMFGYPWFSLAESVAGKTNFTVIYKTNNQTISRSELVNGDFSNRIFNPQTNASPREIRLDVYVTPNAGIQSGDIFDMGYKFYLTENQNVYDSFVLSNRMVNPQVQTRFVSPVTNKIHVYRKPNQSFGAEIRALNQDVVDGNYRILGDLNTSILSGHYYSLVGSYTNEITTDVTNGGWLTNIRANQFLRFGMGGSVSASAHSGDHFTLQLKAQSEHDVNRFDTIDYDVEVIDAKPDLSMSGDLSYGDNQYMPFVVQAQTDRIEYLETNNYTLKVENDLSVGSNVQYILKEDLRYQMNGYALNYKIGATPISLPYSNITLAAGQSTNVTVEMILTNNIPSGSVGLVRLKAFAKEASDLYDTLSIYQQKVTPSVSFYDNSGQSISSNYIQPSESYLLRTTIQNNDSVRDTFYVTANTDTAAIGVHYLEVQGLLTNEITDDVTNGTGHSLSISGGSDAYLYVRFNIASGALSGSKLQSLVRVTPSKNSNIFAIYTNYMEVVDSKPDLSISNIAFLDKNAGNNSYYPTDQSLHDFMILVTNQYALRVENDIVAGDSTAFTVSELGRNNIGAYEIKYFDGATEIPLTNYQLSLAANAHKDLRVQVVLTNTNLASGTEGWLSFKEVSQEISSSYDVLYLYVKKIEPQISFSFDDSSQAKVLWVTNKHATALNIKFANLDPGYDEPIFIRAYPGTNFNLSDPYDEFFSFVFTNIDGSQTNDLTPNLTNAGWTSSALHYNDKKTLKFNANPLPIARTGSFVDTTLIAWPVHDTNRSKTIHLRLNLIDSHVDAQVSGGNLAESSYGGNVYLPTEVTATDRVEMGETNEYTFTIENDDPNSQLQPIKVYPSFSGKVSDFNVVFLTNGTVVDISNLVISLSGGDSGFPVTAHVTPESGAASGDSIKLSLNIKMTNMPVFEDTVDLQVYRVQPTPELLVAGSYDRSWAIDSYKTTPRTFHTYKGAQFIFYMAARNQDKIWDDFVLRATNIVYNDVATNWKFEYTPFSGTNRLPLGTSGLYLSNYQYLDYYVTKLILTPVESASPDATIDSIFTLQSLKNPSVVAVMTNKIDVATGFITGRVSDKKSDLPIEGAKITVQDNTGSKSLTYATNDGTYAVRVYPLFNSQFKVKVEADGYIGEETNFILQIETNYIDFNLVGLNMDGTDSQVRAFPNPTVSGQGAVFVYNVEGDGDDVLVSIYNLSGKLVRKLVEENKNKGASFIHWDGADESGKVVPRGVYLFFIRDNSKVIIRKLFVQ